MRSAVLGTLCPRLQAAVDESVAGAGRHIDPRVLLPVAARGAGARRIGGLAVVLAGLGDAVALLGLELRLGGRAGLAVRGEGQRERGRHGRGDEQVRLLHVESPFERGFASLDTATAAADSRNQRRGRSFFGTREPRRSRGESNGSMDARAESDAGRAVRPPRPWQRLSVRLAGLFAVVTLLAVGAVGLFTYERQQRE